MRPSERGENAWPIRQAPAVPLGPASLDRMVRAVEAVHQRLLRAVSALEEANVPYAVVGGHAVAAWVARVDRAAVRNTPDVDLLLRRGDLPGAAKALERAGFVREEVRGVEMFLDGPGAKVRDAVHVVFAGEKIQADYLLPAPDITESESGNGHRVLNLDALVRMKLTSCRLKDQVHLLDLIGVGLIDATWPGRFPPELAVRLQELLDNPNG